MEKMNRILEIFWLVVTLLSLIFAIYIISTEGFDFGKSYLLVPLVPFAMFLFRRFMRSRLQDKPNPNDKN